MVPEEVYSHRGLGRSKRQGLSEKLAKSESKQPPKRVKTLRRRKLPD